MFFQDIINYFKKLKSKVIIYDENKSKELKYNWQLPKNIKITGGNKTNIVKIHKKLKAKNITIGFCSKNQNCICKLDNSENSNGLNINIYFLPSNNSELFIGKNTEINGAKIWLGNGSKCYIGDNCMISYETIIRTTDGHTILDKESGEILNNQKHHCIIGNNCWIGLRTIINKNVQLADNTIVGSGSILTKQFIEPNIILAGNPAKIIKRNIVHNSKTIYDYEIDVNNKKTKDL